MRKIRTLELGKVGSWGLDGAPITRRDIAEVYETFQGPRPVVIGHEGAKSDKAPKFGDVLDLIDPGDGDVLKGHVSFLEAADPLYEGGYYDGWSVSIPPRAPDGKRFLHHLAILGAVPPKIPGLRELTGVDYSDAGTEYTFSFSGKIPEEVEEVDPKELQAKILELEAKLKALEEENAKLKEAAKEKPAPEAGGDKKPEPSAQAVPKEFSDQLSKVRADLSRSRVESFQTKIEEKVPAGILSKALALAERVSDEEEAEFSDGEKKRTIRPLDLLGEILSAWPPVVKTGSTGNDYSDAKGTDGKSIDWAALAAKA